jgi:hypothetical protein
MSLATNDRCYVERRREGGAAGGVEKAALLEAWRGLEKPTLERLREDMRRCWRPREAWRGLEKTGDAAGGLERCGEA